MVENRTEDQAGPIILLQRQENPTTDMKKIFASIFIQLFSSGFINSHCQLLKPFKHTHLSMNEPSEICNGSSSETFFILGDKAFLYETSADGKVLRKSNIKAYDIEGACVEIGRAHV